jgi:hypothetical protein
MSSTLLRMPPVTSTPCDPPAPRQHIGDVARIDPRNSFRLWVDAWVGGVNPRLANQNNARRSKGRQCRQMRQQLLS